VTGDLPWYVLLFLWLSQPVTGTWSRVEVGWTALALFGLALNTYKLWLVTGDLRAAYTTPRATPRLRERRILVGWWVVNNALVFEVMLSVFVLIGWVAGRLPSIPIDVAHADVPSSAISS
jgi:hypothetical protein